MKKYLGILMIAAALAACNNETESKTDNEKAATSEASEAADTSNVVDKAQSKMNEVIDSAQSKGGRLADTIGKKIVEPAKKEVNKVGAKLKEKVKEVKEAVKQ
ncbi:MAG: hypothetical protein K2X48_15305 [Chitinophagaceae bacterium]|nr:hypothetical protein [Chitinophagaceae bacterium]